MLEEGGKDEEEGEEAPFIVHNTYHIMCVSATANMLDHLLDRARAISLNNLPRR